MTTSRFTASGLAALAIFSICNLHPATARAQATAFTYQGRLNEGGNPAGGIYDFRFTIHDAAVAGNAVGAALTNAATPVANGLFAATLDFGGAVFTGSVRWLEIAVRTNGGGSFATLLPRQPLTPAPYALYAPIAGSATAVTGPVAAGQITGDISSNNIASGTITGNMLADGAVGGAQLASNSITAGHMAGPVAAAATAGNTTNNDVSVNMDLFPALDKALLYSNQLSFVLFGDSVGEYTWRRLAPMVSTYSTFPASYGALRYNGESVEGWGPFIGSVLSGVYVTNYGTALDIWWGANQFWVVTNGQPHCWSMANGTALNGNLLKLWYAATSTNGVIRLATSTDRTNWTDHVVQDTSVLARGLYCTNVALPTDNYYVRVSSDSGSCIYLWPQLVHTNSRATHVQPMCAGGRMLKDLLNMGEANLATILTNAWPYPTVIAYSSVKPVYELTNWPAVLSLFRKYCPNSDVMLAQMPGSTIPSVESDPANGAVFQAIAKQSLATIYHHPFMDLRSSFADTNRTLALGYYSDFIHHTAAGQAAIAADFWSRLKLMERFTASINFTVASHPLTNITVWNSLQYRDSSQGGRRLVVTNGWGPTRAALYFAVPSADGTNWNVAGDANAVGIGSGSGGEYHYTGAARDRGFQLKPSGGITIWGPSYSYANDDPGFGGLIVSGNQTNHGNLDVANLNVRNEYEFIRCGSLNVQGTGCARASWPNPTLLGTHSFGESWQQTAANASAFSFGLAIEPDVTNVVVRYQWVSGDSNPGRVIHWTDTWTSYYNWDGGRVNSSGVNYTTNIFCTSNYARSVVMNIPMPATNAWKQLGFSASASTNATSRNLPYGLRITKQR